MLKKCENDLLGQFAARNLHLIQPNRPKNDMEWLCLMQHYNVATRLLDWTENAMIAFLFALEDFFKSEDFDRTILPCIWTLKPYELNKMVGLHEIPNLSFIGDKEWRSKRYEKSDKQKANKIEKGFIVKSDNCEAIVTPIAVLHPLTNDRIRAQFGTFTIFPIFQNTKVDSKNPCTDCLKSDKRDEKKFNMFALEEMKSCETYLKKYIILNPEKVYKELKNMGFRRSMLYPEMPNTSVEIEENIFR